MKEQYFENEIAKINNPRIKDFLIGAINDIPDYFFEAPASSSGKHHPAYALGKGGLLRHTKAAVLVLEQLLRLEKYADFTEDEKDLLIVAVVLHDSRKSGDNCDKIVLANGENGEIYESKTLPLHPKLAAKAIVQNKDNFSKLTKAEGVFLLTSMITHMGQWNKDGEGNVILPKPKTLNQEIVHLSDFIASRKILEVNFNAERE